MVSFVRRAASAAALVLCASGSVLGNPKGACCFDFGSGGAQCEFMEPDDCADLGGVYQGDGTFCEEFTCLGACCFDVGCGPQCLELTPGLCFAVGGTFSGLGVDCVASGCLPEGACCLFDVASGDADCEVLTQPDCVTSGGLFQGPGTSCAPFPCDSIEIPFGACCFPERANSSGLCSEEFETYCTENGGLFLGDGTDCEDVDCTDFGACCLPCDAASGGSPSVCSVTSAESCEAAGGVYQGDGTNCALELCEPVGACCFAECGEPETVICSVLTESNCLGQGGMFMGDHTTCFSVVCVTPCDLPGRPANDGTNDRVLRGFIVGWAVNADNAEIRHNHLAGNATTIDYRHGAARQVNAWSFPVVDSAANHGQALGSPGELYLDGTEYVPAYSSLLMNFTAEGSAAFSGPSDLLVSRSQLTLHPVSVDFRDGGVPVTTKASFEVWNENEVKFSGMHRCVTCWDETVLGDYGVPNHFNLPSLQTDFGSARIDGLASALCPDSTDATLLGQIAQTMGVEPCETFGPAISGSFAAGRNLVGMGTQGAVIRYDLEAPPEESPADAALRGLLAGHGAARGGAPATLSPPVDVPDRVSGTEKGSLVYFSSVEVRWDCEGNLVQDTFVQLTNDHPDAVRVQFYFVNGDAPLHDEACDEQHPGWNFVDNAITLTGNQTIWWSVLTGQPYGLSPFTVLDP